MNPFNERLNEIIFEKRNKNYGAYVLRKEYAGSLKIALYIATAFAGLVALSGVLLRKEVIKVPKLDEGFIIDTGIVVIIDPKPKDPEPDKKATPPPAAPPKDIIKEVKDEPLETKEPEHAQDEETVTGTTPSDGDKGETDDINTGGEEGGIVPETPAKEEEKPFVYVKEMPDIEGGILPYVQHHLNYPELAKENRTSGTVHISFVVERDGSISNINILNDPKVGDGCEEEAIRVIKSAKWIPGKNNGHPVRVKLTLPVRYQIQ